MIENSMLLFYADKLEGRWSDCTLMWRVTLEKWCFLQPEARCRWLVDLQWHTLSFPVEKRGRKGHWKEKNEGGYEENIMDKNYIKYTG